MIERRMSRQLALYLRAREFGHGRADAAAYAGISVDEAAMHDADHGWDQPTDNFNTEAKD